MVQKLANVLCKWLLTKLSNHIFEICCVIKNGLLMFLTRAHLLTQLLACASLALQIQDHKSDNSSIRFEPEVYAETNGSIIRPLSLNLPPEVLRSASNDATRGTSTVRTVCLLHRTSVLFPSRETSDWV